MLLEKDITYKYITDHSVPYKILGHNIEVEMSNHVVGNVIVFGAPGTGKESCYINPNLKYAHGHSNFLIHTISDEIIQNAKNWLPGYEVIEIDLGTRPLDYFSLITNEEETVNFVAFLMEAYDEFSNAFLDRYQEQVMTRMLLDAIRFTLKEGGCSYEAIYNLFQKEDTSWISIADKISENEIKSVRITYLKLLDDFRKQPGSIDIIRAMKKLVHNQKVAVIVKARANCDTLYDRIFMNELVELYQKFYRETDQHGDYVKVILDEAPRCYIDEMVLSSEYNMSIDFIYQNIEQMKFQYPNDVWTRFMANRIAIVCLGTKNEFTAHLLSHEFSYDVTEFDMLNLPMEREVIYYPRLVNSLAIVDKEFVRNHSEFIRSI